MKRILSILIPYQESYKARKAEQLAKEELLNQKLNELHTATKNIILDGPISISVTFGWYKKYEVKIAPWFRLHRTDIKPEPDIDDFIKIVDYLLEEVV